MQVCRTRAECPAGMACYPSRRSANVHFCAPVPATAVRNEGDVCSGDSECVTAVCHEARCREVCVRDADCGGGDRLCRAVVRNQHYIPSVIATGICVPRDPTKLPLGATCSSGSSCQSGSCGQANLGGGNACVKACGSAYDCGTSERCAPGMYSLDPVSGYGYRNCAPAGGLATAGVGDSCYLFGASDCKSLFCDGSFFIDVSDYLIEPYCTGHCDKDEDCPLLFGGEYNLKLRCSITSSSDILPLVAGYCTPFWCNSTADCNPGDTCFIFNTDGWGGYPQGMCR